MANIWKPFPAVYLVSDCDLFELVNTINNTGKRRPPTEQGWLYIPQRALISEENSFSVYTQAHFSAECSVISLVYCRPLHPPPFFQFVISYVFMLVAMVLLQLLPKLEMSSIAKNIAKSL